ncbi:hypothetical protein B0I35DRAFT_481784 [Stachybotrys elegans]|uniref:Uncharacterized protein n=1 Tax=Stachybotrys elegans TaxID=80388 RepID=A0A8K0SN64_9HYPO|nr:hypothetical protein B0I35DRAFT_481784 [Stachybotrys elegans]
MAPSTEPQPSATAPTVVQPMQVEQPRLNQAMDPQRPHPESDVNLRGGENRGGCCPGRFCFIIPCPLPCDCCIIPCP